MHSRHFLLPFVAFFDASSPGINATGTVHGHIPFQGLKSPEAPLSAQQQAALEMPGGSWASTLTTNPNPTAHSSLYRM